MYIGDLKRSLVRVILRRFEDEKPFLCGFEFQNYTQSLGTMIVNFRPKTQPEVSSRGDNH